MLCGVGMQEKVLFNDSSQFFFGGVIDGYLVNNLCGDVCDGLGNWSEVDIVVFFKIGCNSYFVVFGGMVDVVVNSIQYMIEEDFLVMVKYLKLLKVVKEGMLVLVYDDKIYQVLCKGSDQSLGVMVFLNNCVVCYCSSGKGYDEIFLILVLLLMVNVENLVLLICIVLEGVEMFWIYKVLMQFVMLGFVSCLLDQEVVDVVIFICSSWGNQVFLVNVFDVVKVCKQLLEKKMVEVGSVLLVKQQ